MKEDEECTCTPCTNPGRWGHCAECCMGSLIEEYDFECPISEHREWAARQFGTEVRG